MSHVTLDANELEFSASDLRTPTLVTGQVYRWSISKIESQVSKNGNKMAVVEIQPVTEQGKKLAQYRQRVYMTVPTATIKAKSEKTYNLIKDNYFRFLQAFASPTFNAFSKIEKTATGTVYYGANGEVLTGKAREEAREGARKAMMDGRDAFLAGELTPVGSEAYAAFLPAKEGSDWPQISNFSDYLSETSKYPFADSFNDMIK